MMTDKPIISRCANCGTAVQLCSGSGCKEAADEIERLRADNEKLLAIAKAADAFYMANNAPKTETQERLDAELCKLICDYFGYGKSSDSFTREDSNHE